MARRKGKSMNDIMRQNYRIQRELGENYGRYSDVERKIDRAASATRRYNKNIRRSINAWGAARGIPLYGADAERKVARRTYMGLANG